MRKTAQVCFWWLVEDILFFFHHRHQQLVIIINIVHKTTTMSSTSALTNKRKQQQQASDTSPSPGTKAVLREIGLLSPEETSPQESPASFSSSPVLSAWSPSAVLQPAYSPTTTTEDQADLISKLGRIAAGSRNRRVLKVKDTATVFTNSDDIGIAMALGSNVSSALRPVIGFESEDNEDKRVAVHAALDLAQADRPNFTKSSYNGRRVSRFPLEQSRGQIRRARF
jgi:hypothetical protein